MTESAEQLTERLIKPLGERWEHTQAVVRQAHRLAEFFTPAEHDALLSASWLHDLGYAAAVAVTGFHPLDGARYLRGKVDAQVVSLVAYHSSAAAEARARRLDAELADFERPPARLASALCWCDMTSGPAGEVMTLAQRLADVRDRYGAGHVVTRSLRDAEPQLVQAIHDVEDLLSLASTA